MTQEVHDFPLAALVGQDRLKTALLLCAVNPGIGGVLIRGDKGSAKSTAARGLAAVMAPIERVVGCAYNCAPSEPATGCEVCNGPQREVQTTPVPFVNLPLGAGEDRVLGSLDFERALKDGRKAFQPGLLASAHRGILYIDEVNLLPDHLVDVLLDAAAMGVNRVQREGLSVQHPARIALLGTMNREEGELRPQLLDRFGLMVEVRAPQEPRLRAEIVRRRLAWEGGPEGFVDTWGPHQLALREQVLRARVLLPKVTLAEGLLVLISELCCSQGVTSLRADLVMNKAARALAALRGRTSVEPDDLSEAAMLVLPHRRRSRPFEEPGLDEAELERVMRRASANGSPNSADSRAGTGGDDSGGRRDGPGREARKVDGDEVDDAREGEAPSGERAGERGGARHGAQRDVTKGDGDAGDRREGDGSETGEGAGDERGGRVFPAGTGGKAPRIELRAGVVAGAVVGRRSVAVESRRGREVRAVPERRPTDLAVTATLHHSLVRTGGRLEVTAEDLHQKVRAGRHGTLILFVVDASGSMAALQRMEMVKATVLSLLRDAYERRDEVGVIAFRGTKAELLLAPTRSVDTAERELRDLPTGGRTPLAHALHVASDVLNRSTGAARPEPLLIVLSDGKANVPLDGSGDRSRGSADVPSGDAWQQVLQYADSLARRGVAALVLDTEVGFVRMGRARDLADALGARCLSLEEFDAASLSLTIRSHLRGSRGAP
jgi:magnesium chelatase subunit D